MCFLRMRRPPRSTRHDTLLPCTTLVLSDGQGFLVKKGLGGSKLAELDGASICVSAGTTTELNLADYFRTHSLGYTPIVANSREQNLANLESEIGRASCRERVCQYV